MSGAIARADRAASSMTMQTLAHIADSYVQASNGGEINISDHETLLMQDHEYNLTAKVNAKDHAEIIIRNSRVTLSPPYSNKISILSKGESRLLVFNSTINFARLGGFDCNIVLEDQAEANLTETIIAGWGYVVGRDASAVYVEKSQIGSGVARGDSPGLVSYGTSRVSVKDSAVEVVYVWENSTASIDGADVGLIRTGETAINVTNSRVENIQTAMMNEPPARTVAIHITNSTVEHALRVNYNSIAWVEKSKLAMVTAFDNATVWLIESSVDDVSLEGNARVLFGWYLPLFGLLGVPYSLIPVLQAGSITVMVIGMATISYAAYRKRKQKKNSAG